jgi:hypothetical protein
MPSALQLELWLDAAFTLTQASHPKHLLAISVEHLKKLDAQVGRGGAQGLTRTERKTCLPINVHNCMAMK